MIEKWKFAGAAAALALGLGFAPSVLADAPWANLLTVNHVKADPNDRYTLTDNQGPWIITTCSFSGPNAEKQAHELVLELRQRYRMEAYVHEADFKLDDPNGESQSSVASPHRYVYHKVTENPSEYADGKIKEIAVVVGNFAAVDDVDAQRTLKKIKAADPDCLNPNREKDESRSLAWWRKIQAQAGAAIPKEIEGRKFNGPLCRAFITRNPLLPEEYFVPKTGLDELVVKMNKNVKYSLLDCPGRYTVQVAHFTGEVVLNQGEIRAIESGSRPGPESTKQGLAQAAEKAHELTEALRMKGWEAYEFHDRNSSMVTVGHFDAVAQCRRTGPSRSCRRSSGSLTFADSRKSKNRAARQSSKCSRASAFFSIPSLFPSRCPAARSAGNWGSGWKWRGSKMLSLQSSVFSPEH